MSAPVWSWSDVDWTGHEPPRPKKPVPVARAAALQAPLPAPAPTRKKFAVRAVTPSRPRPAQKPPGAAPGLPRPSKPNPVLRPFRTPQEALYWAVSSREQTYLDRSCRPSDIFAALGRLHRQRKVSRDHIRVLGIWARLGHPPAATRGVERCLWDEAMERLGAALRECGIVA